MKSITQEEPMGCGIACTAFALNKKYGSAKKLFDNPENSTSRGYYCREIVSALKKAGREYTFSKFGQKTRNKIKEGSIVFVSKCARYPSGHFLVKTNQCWMN